MSPLRKHLRLTLRQNEHHSIMQEMLRRGKKGRFEAINWLIHFVGKNLAQVPNDARITLQKEALVFSSLACAWTAPKIYFDVPSWAEMARWQKIAIVALKTLTTPGPTPSLQLNGVFFSWGRSRNAMRDRLLRPRFDLPLPFGTLLHAMPSSSRAAWRCAVVFLLSTYHRDLRCCQGCEKTFFLATRSSQMYCSHPCYSLWFARKANQVSPDRYGLRGRPRKQVKRGKYGKARA
jgi:hypothetical protein